MDECVLADAKKSDHTKKSKKAEKKWALVDLLDGVLSI